jgi:ribose transport system substrate-binding protein
MIEQIVGRRAGGFHAPDSGTAAGAPLVELIGVSGVRRPRKVDLVIHRGEVVGVAGLLGSGRSALARVLCGIDKLVEGEIRVSGKPVRISKPADAIAAGIVLVPEDRRRQGFVAGHSVASNICLPVIDKLSRYSWVRTGAARRLADEQIKRLRVKTASRDSAISTLSGGNAQKVVIAKWLAAEPELIVLDEPTAGIDIGSKGEIIALIRDLARQGKAVLILSSELAELLAASDRIVVMSNGELVRTITRAELDEASAAATDPIERLQLAERQLQMALQHRAQQWSMPLSRGPHGEAPEAAANLSLSDDELRRLRAMRAKIAIVLHYGDNDWTRGQLDGMKAQFASMGCDVVAVTDAGFRPQQQIADIASVMQQKPDLIVSIPTDPKATSDSYRAASRQGARLIFMDHVPEGLTAGADYTSCVSADNYAGGVAAAHLVGRALEGRGQIGLVSHAAEFFVTQQRRDGFCATVAESYPDIRIVGEEAISGPEFAAQGDQAASALLSSHPELAAIWAVWDVPAQGVIAAARRAGRDDLKIVTHDLGTAVAAEMARGGLVVGVAAQRCYDQGVTEALLAGYALLDKPAPAYVALPALSVDRSNLSDAWQIVYRQPFPPHFTNQQRAA